MQKNENKPANTPKHLGQHLRYSNKFVGRIKEKDDIRQLLQQHDSLVVVNGMGGIGKTSIAYNLMQEDQNAYQHLIWTNLEIPSYGRKEMLKNTLLYQSRPLHLHLGIAEKLQTAKDTAEKWEILWHRISMLQGKVLWVMDNVRADDVATIKSLPKTCTFLLTSRQELNGIETYKLDELKADDALKLFKTYYKGKNEDDILAQICQTVHFHALSIELLARNLAAIDDMTAQQFLEKLQESLLHHQPQAEVYTAYTQKKMDMYSVLTFAFRLGDMYHIKELHPLLHVFTLLPYVPTPYFLFEKLLEIETKEEKKWLRRDLQELRQKGWIQQDNENALLEKGKGYKMHKVIQACIETQLQSKFSEEQKEKYIEILWHMTWAVYEQNEIEAQVFLPYFEYITNKNIVGNDNKIKLIEGMSILYGVIGNYESALKFRKEVIEILEKLRNIEDDYLAAIYSNIGLTYQNLANYQQALTYQKKCLAIREEILNENHPELANIHANIGITYKNLGDYEQASIYNQKCLATWEKFLVSWGRFLDEKSQDMAIVYANIADTYSQLANHEKALFYQKECLLIWEVLDIKHPNLALTYTNIADTYSNLADYEQALAYQKKCLVIREEILNERHPDLAGIYFNIAATYNDLADYEQALFYEKKCLAIREEILSERHPDLASIYNNIAVTYNDLADYEQALAYEKKCLAIREEILSEKHPDLADIYNNIGLTYRFLEQHKIAMEYVQKSIAIYEQLPAYALARLEKAEQLEKYILMEMNPEEEAKKGCAFPFFAAVLFLGGGFCFAFTKIGFW